jgi:hypothetical protein
MTATGGLVGAAIFTHSLHIVIIYYNPYFACVSCNKSGTTVTNAIYIKPPEVKGNIHAVLSPADLAESAVNAATAPTKPPMYSE